MCKTSRCGDLRRCDWHRPSTGVGQACDQLPIEANCAVGPVRFALGSGHFPDLLFARCACDRIRFSNPLHVTTYAECVSLAAMLEERFDELLVSKRSKKSQVEHEELSRTGRQFATSGLSEVEIMQILGSFCSSVEQDHAGPRGKHLQQACTEILTPAAVNSIEDSVFQYGTKTVMSQMCIEVAGVCEHHTLIDRGEL